MPTDWAEGILVADLGDEPELSEELSAVFERLKVVPLAQTPHVVLNFGGVNYLNSSHIAALLRMRKRVVEADRQLVLASVGDELWSIFTLTGLEKVFVVAPDMLTALARVQLAAGSDEA